MSTQESWICNGTPQNGKEYPGLGFPHDPHENYSSDCEICGLPRESSVAKNASPGLQLAKKPLLMALGFGGLALMLAGGGTFFVLANRCEPGFQRIEGQCIDPFQEPYELAKSEGDQAISLFNNYQSFEDLGKSNTSLQNAIGQLEQIPSDAPIYSEALATAELYQKEQEKVALLIDSETLASEKLKNIENAINQASNTTDNAKNIPQYEGAKKQWQQVKSELGSQELESSKLVSGTKQQYIAKSEEQIQALDNKIKETERQLRISNNNRTITQRRNPSLSRNVSKPSSVNNNKSNSSPVVTTKSSPQKPIVRKSKPQVSKPAIPSDPCAATPQPPQCRF